MKKIELIWSNNILSIIGARQLYIKTKHFFKIQNRFGVYSEINETDQKQFFQPITH